MRQFVEDHLSYLKVEYRADFIRLDKVNVTSDNEVQPDVIMISDHFAKRVMEACRFEATFSADWWRQVGAAAVCDDKILLSGINRMLPSDQSPYIDGDIRGCFGFGEHLEICGTIHAEAAVIAKAAKEGVSLAGVDFYCTTFPCPMCARLLAEAGIGQLIYDVGYSVSDAFHIFRAAGVKVAKLIW